MEVKRFLDRNKHPFYKHGDATQFLALRDGAAVGRILVSDDPNYNQEHGTNLGCFGLFESVDDPQVAGALLDAADDWLRRRGRTSIMGPIEYSTNYTCGLLIDGFDTPPRVLMNHNPPYYAGLLESCGLTKVKDLYCWWFVDPLNLLETWGPRLERIAQRKPVHIRPFCMKDLKAEAARCRELYNGSQVENWGFVRLTDAEFDDFVKQMAQIADPNWVLIAEVDGKPVGFSLTLPDVNEALRSCNGYLTTFGIPIGLCRLLWRFRKVQKCRMVILVVLKKYRRRGIAEQLILRALHYGKDGFHFNGAELSWTLEDNVMINRTIEAVGAKRYKTYRIFEKPITP